MVVEPFKINNKVTTHVLCCSSTMHLLGNDCNGGVICDCALAEVGATAHRQYQIENKQGSKGEEY